MNRHMGYQSTILMTPYEYEELQGDPIPVPFLLVVVWREQSVHFVVEETYPFQNLEKKLKIRLKTIDFVQLLPIQSKKSHIEVLLLKGHSCIVYVRTQELEYEVVGESGFWSVKRIVQI